MCGPLALHSSPGCASQHYGATVQPNKRGVAQVRVGPRGAEVTHQVGHFTAWGRQLEWVTSAPWPRIRSEL